MAASKPRRPPPLRTALEQLYRLQFPQEDCSLPMKHFVKLWTLAVRGNLTEVELFNSGLCHVDSFTFLLQHLKRTKTKERVEELAAAYRNLDYNSEPSSAATCDPDLLLLLEPLEITLSEPVEPVKKRHAPDLALTQLKRTAKNGRVEPPKKEYFRCQHIRALKKSWRQLGCGKRPGASIHQVETLTQNELWQQLTEMYHTHEELLQRLSATEAGPLTDGKHKPHVEELQPQAKSFNNEFCRNFFMSWEVQEYNRVFCDLVYDVSPASLCRKLKLQCCNHFTHSEACAEVWANVKHFAQRGMLEELAVTCEMPITEEALDMLV